MTGKSLKLFAAGLPDGAEIEINMERLYRAEWEPLKADTIRAIFTPTTEAAPLLDEDEVVA